MSCVKFIIHLRSRLLSLYRCHVNMGGQSSEHNFHPAHSVPRGPSLAFTEHAEHRSKASAAYCSSGSSCPKSLHLMDTLSVFVFSSCSLLFLIYGPRCSLCLMLCSVSAHFSLFVYVSDLRDINCNPDWFKKRVYFAHRLL